MESSNEYMKPGGNLKPNVTLQNVQTLLFKLYDIDSSDIHELNAYVDRNYLINDGENKFVMKILTSVESQNTEYIDAQNELLTFLSDKGFNVPNIIKNVHGHHFSTEIIGQTQHNVRLLKFIPGAVMAEIKPSDDLYFEVGKHLAKMATDMQNFRHPGLMSRKSVWMLDYVTELEPFFHAVTDNRKLEVVKEVMKKFQDVVIPKMVQFEKGTIHSDLNEHNIVVIPDETDRYQLSGVLDFGDICHSCLIFDLAVTMAYMMWQSGELTTGRLILAGYRSVRSVPHEEVQVLKICVAARYCQSLVLSSYTHTTDPTNDYILTDLKGVWEALQLVWTQTDDHLFNLWNNNVIS